MNSRSSSRNRSRSPSRNRSYNSESPKTRKISRTKYNSPIKRGSITHPIFEGEDQYERIQELLNDPDVLVGDKISKCNKSL